MNIVDGIISFTKNVGNGNNQFLDNIDAYLKPAHDVINKSKSGEIYKISNQPSEKCNNDL